MATTNGITPRENGRAVAAMVREEDLDELKALHTDLQQRIDSARTDGRLFMMSQYVRLLALVTPEIDRIQKRFNRETLAMHRRDHKDLKLAAKNGAST
jgi:hypothetical protein